MEQASGESLGEVEETKKEENSRDWGCMLVKKRSQNVDDIVYNNSFI